MEKNTLRGPLWSVLSNYYSGEQIKTETGGGCSSYGKDDKCIQDFGGETWGKEPFGRPRHRWEDSIKMNLQEVGGGMGRIDLSQDKDRWWAVVNAVMNFLVPYNAGNFLTSWGPVSFSRRTVLFYAVIFCSKPPAHLMRTACVVTGIHKRLTYSHFLSHVTQYYGDVIGHPGGIISWLFLQIIVADTDMWRCR